MVRDRMAHARVSVPEGIGLTFGDFVRDVAERFGPRPALVFEGRTWTYSELEAEIRECSKALLASGVVKGTRVGILAANRPEWIVASLAAGSIGGVLIPISTFASQDERDYVLRHSDTSVLLVEDALLKHQFVAELCKAYPELETGERMPSLPFLRRVVEIPA